MNKSQKTLMGKYYSVCCAIILLSMVLVGSIFMVLANDYLREEKISLLEKNVNQAARLTMENYAAHEYRYVSSDTLQPVYAVLGSAIEADIYLSDNKGNILIMAHTTEGTVPQSVPEAVLESLSKTGSYQGSVMMAGTGEDPQYAVATPVVDENGLLVGAVMATARAANRALAGDMLQMFLIAAIVVLVVSFIVIYFVTTSLVNPCGRWPRRPVPLPRATFRSGCRWRGTMRSGGWPPPLTIWPPSWRSPNRYGAALPPMSATN